jgi:hypothetical protein
MSCQRAQPAALLVTRCQVPQQPSSCMPQDQQADKAQALKPHHPTHQPLPCTAAFREACHVDCCCSKHLM